MIGTRRALIGAGNAIRYLLRASFGTDIAAPLPASLPVDVGGPLTTVQVDGQLSQSGGKLVFPAQTTPANGDQGFYEVARSRTAGRSLLAVVNFSTLSGKFCYPLTWARSATVNFGGSVNVADQFFLNGGSALVLVQNAVGSTTVVLAALSSGTDYQLVLILRSAGAFYLIKGGAFTNWTLAWVSNSDTTATVYPAFSNYDAVGTLDNFRVLDLGTISSLFSGDYTLATDRKATFVASDAITMQAEALVEETFTAATGVTTELYVRRVDTNNTWIIRCSQGGSTVKLIEKVAGVETERASAAQTWTNATSYRLMIVCEGAVIKTYVADTLKSTYSSASFQQTATIAGVGHAGTNLIAWPRTVSLPNV